MVIPKDRLEEVKEASFNTFTKYFENDKKKYLASLEKLSAKNLEKFLNLERFYYRYFLSLQPTPDFDPVRDFSLIAFFSLIEAIMSEKPWRSFQDWLSEKDFPIGIKNKEDLKRLKEEYYEMYGSGKKAREFFDKYVEDGDKQVFLNKLRISKLDKTKATEIKVSLDKLIKIVYELRSKFLHDARRLSLFPRTKLLHKDAILVGSSVLSLLGNEYLIDSELNVELLQGILEKGMLRYFGLLA